MPSRRSFLVAMLAASVSMCAIVASAGAEDCEVKLLASDGAHSDHFGSSVAASADLVLVGSRLDDDVCIDNPNCNSGSAYVYRFDGSQWNEEQKLTASDAEVFHTFGRDVALSGNVALVGAPGFGSGSSEAAYVYRFDGASWVEEQKLDGSGNFGFSVAVDGDVAVVGALTDGDAGFEAGAAYVYRFDGTDWIEEQKLIGSDTQAGDKFGTDVALSGSWIVIGAPDDDDAGSQSGSAYVFFLADSSWIELHKLVPTGAGTNDFVGSNVATDGDVLVLSSIFDDDGGSNAGGAYVYRRDGFSWNQEQKLLACDGHPEQAFGSDVDVDGDKIAVGASGDNHACPSNPNCDAGAVYVFEHDGTNWIESTKFVPSDGFERDFFGGSVAVSGSVVIGGASLDDDLCAGLECNSGAAYLYDLTECRPFPCESLGCVDSLVVGNGFGAGSEFDLEFCFTNCGAWTTSYDFSVSDPMGWCAGSSGTISLEPGAKHCVTVACSVPGTAPGGTVNSVTLNLQPTGCPADADSCSTKLTVDELVPVTLEAFEGIADAGGVLLTWRLGPGWENELLDVGVQRADAYQGPYTDLTASLQLARQMSFRDATAEPGRDYWYRLVRVTAAGLLAGRPIEIRGDASALRTQLFVPIVPANGAPVQLRFTLAKAGHAKLEVYDVRGRLVRAIDQGRRNAGTFIRTWDRRDTSGVRMARGVYIVKLSTQQLKSSQKLVLVGH